MGERQNTADQKFRSAPPKTPKSEIKDPDMNAGNHQDHQGHICSHQRIKRSSMSGHFCGIHGDEAFEGLLHILGHALEITERSLMGRSSGISNTELKSVLSRWLIKGLKYSEKFTVGGLSVNPTETWPREHDKLWHTEDGRLEMSRCWFLSGVGTALRLVRVSFVYRSCSETEAESLNASLKTGVDNMLFRPVWESICVTFHWMWAAVSSPPLHSHHSPRRPLRFQSLHLFVSLCSLSLDRPRSL